jgi:endonuclease/exonuclease/phosphatase family metal-dependent hydrolase
MPTHKLPAGRGDTIRGIALPMLAITLGLQTLRAFYPLLAWYLMDSLGAGPLVVAAYAFAVFLPAFLAAALRRALGPRVALVATAGGVAALRIAEQFVREPAIDLWLVIAGSILFLLFLPLWIGHARAAGPADTAYRLGCGITLGLALDSAIKGAAGTVDLAWLHGPAPAAVVIGLSTALLGLAVTEPQPAPSVFSDTRLPDALPLLALGAYLALQAMVFQNQGWVATVSGLDMPRALLVVAAGNLAAVLALAWGRRTGFAYRGWLAPALAAYVFLASLTAGRPAPSFALVVVVAQAAHGWGWGLIASLLARAARPGLRATTLIYGLGMLLFLLVPFLYYTSFEIAIPLPRSVLLPGASAVFGAALVYTAMRLRPTTLEPRREWVGPLFMAMISLIPLTCAWLEQDPPSFARPEPPPIRLMTYNIHSAFDVQGRQDPEAIAQVIEHSGADIIALQEVSRGWLIDGATDLAGWLSRRLDMPFLFRGTADPVWGNAILCRFPIINHGWGPLPRDGTLLPRGYLWAEVVLDEGPSLFVLVTHLHHIGEAHDVRQSQVTALLSFWQARPFSVLLGDLNARPSYPEMDMLAEAGWRDSWSEAGLGEGLTWPAHDPFERIDWVWHTGDLVATEATVLISTASDHLPVVVALETVH